MQRAHEAQLKQDFQQAAQWYREATKLKPSSVLYEKLGLACFLGDSQLEAIQAFSEAVRLEPRRWASQLYLGISLYKTNRFQEALSHIDWALQLNPQQNEARYWLGLTYSALGNYEQSVEHLRRALHAEPENVDILYALTRAFLDFSTVLSKQLDPDRPDQERRRAIDKKLGLDSAMVRDAASWNQAIQRWEETEGRYKGVLKSDQPGGESLYILSQVYGELAQLMAERVWELNPDSYRSHQLLGEAYEAKENYEEAHREYREALRLNPSAPGLHYSIGHAYWQMKRFNEAIPELEKELALNPNNASANYVLGHIYLYLDRGHPGKAASYLERAVKAKPDFVEARKQWAKALTLLHDDREAARELEAAARSDPEDDSVHYLLASVYKKMGLHDKAQKELDTFNQLRRHKHVHDKPQD